MAMLEISDLPRQWRMFFIRLMGLDSSFLHADGPVAHHVIFEAWNSVERKQAEKSRPSPNDSVTTSKAFSAASQSRQALHRAAVDYADAHKVSYAEAVVAVTSSLSAPPAGFVTASKSDYGPSSDIPPLHRDWLEFLYHLMGLDRSFLLAEPDQQQQAITLAWNLIVKRSTQDAPLAKVSGNDAVSSSRCFRASPQERQELHRNAIAYADENGVSYEAAVEKVSGSTTASKWDLPKVLPLSVLDDAVPAASVGPRVAL